MNDSKWYASPRMLLAADVVVGLVLFWLTRDDLTASTTGFPLGPAGLEPPVEVGRRLGPGDLDPPTDDGMLTLVAAIASAPVALRRPAPVMSLVLAAVVMVWNPYPIHQLTSVGGLSVVLCAYTVATRVPVIGAVAVWIVPTLAEILYRPQPFGLELLLLPVVLVLGQVVRARRRTQAELTAQAEQTLAAQAVAEERLRIARELHDVVAHHMSAIAIQSEAVRLRAAGDAALLDTGLAEVREISLEAISEMRQIVGTLRQAPAPDLDRVGELFDTVRAAGHPVTVTSEFGEVDPPVGETAYRILQESLSNAMRHAPGAEVSVDVGRTEAELVIVVANRPPLAAAPAAGGGHGIIGMRERAELLGGSLEAGPRPEGGFEVRARLPLGRTIG
ncbi:sensor histidine kinase [Nonomuraea sp. bgisy101]|uniref:sensor histidine kinase n=1 Tax=Nonomuraea sp. bgisy101 TaxID=3413784 RepID=UPI003D744674